MFQLSLFHLVFIFALLLFFLIGTYSLYFQLNIDRVDFFRVIAISIIIFLFFVDPRFGLVAIIAAIAASHLFSIEKTTLDKSAVSSKSSNPIETKIKRLNDQEIAVSTIPKNIIQIWVEKTPMTPKGIPRKEAQYASQMKKMNPGFNYLFFEEKDVEPFFTKYYPEYYSTYKRLPKFIQKMDFFRYLVLYHYGGFYFDMDVYPINPLDNAICAHNAVFPVDEYILGMMEKMPRFGPILEDGQNFLIGQYAFGCIPGHPFLKEAIDKIHKSIDSYIKTENNGEIYVYRTTGPDFLTGVYAKFANPESIYILSNGRRQMFGDYAEHIYSGNWKL